ncbi:MAG: DinB family protein [Gemmatimonadaceae bacterium]
MRVYLGAALALAPLLLGAQTPSRLAMIGEWEHQKKHALAVVDVAPDSMLGFRATPGVRTFAEQIIHAAGTAAYIAADALGIKPPADLMGDRDVFFKNKTALRGQTEKFYDYVIGILKGAPESALLRDATVFGGVKPAWLWVATAHSHGTWTLGQTVPYLRMNNVKPPEFTPF